MLETPFYHLVPKETKANLAWRREAVRLGMTNKKWAEEFWIMSSRDPLFWLNTFVWTFDPLKKAEAPVLPFITYPCQDDALALIFDGIGRHDVLGKKSRDMGATWCVLTAFFHRWCFKDRQSFLVASRNESYVDQPGNDKTLFSKLDFILEHLPSWMKPKYTRTAMRLGNDNNRSVINGEAATGDLARGDRRTAILWDECAAWDVADGFRAESSTISATSCRIIVSTPRGMGNIYAKKALDPKTKHVFTLHWTQHPDKARGMYVARNGVVERLDKFEGTVEMNGETFQYPGTYPFVLDGKIRSPWYDDFCCRTPIPSIIAQELDMDLLGSGGQFFDNAVLEAHKKLYLRPPQFVGELTYDADGDFGEFVEKPGGSLLLWMFLSGGKPNPNDEFVVACDIGQGTGASNSALSVISRRTGEKVAEWTSKHTRPEEFACLAVAIARWCNEAFLIWEANGPGRPFGAKVIELGYRNYYYNRDENKFPKQGTRKPGFYTTPTSKQMLLTEYHEALARGKFINHSQAALKECAEVVYQDNGTIGHQAAQNTVDDPSGSGDNHADIVIADALAWKGVRERPVAEDEDRPKEIPANCFASRMARAAAEEAEGKSRMVFA